MVRPARTKSRSGGRKARGAKSDLPLDRELSDLPADLRWREWMNRIEAVLFASAVPVEREALARLVGQGASLDLLIEDIEAELSGRPYGPVKVGSGWLLRSRARFAEAIRAAADPVDETLSYSETEMAVLAAIAYHQPIDRSGLADIFGREISRDLLGRLRQQQLISNGPRSPRPGAPVTFVTTDHFLATFDLETLRDLPDIGEIGPE